MPSLLPYRPSSRQMVSWALRLNHLYNKYGQANRLRITSGSLPIFRCLTLMRTQRSRRTLSRYTSSVWLAKPLLAFTCSGRARAARCRHLRTCCVRSLFRLRCEVVLSWHRHVTRCRSGNCLTTTCFDGLQKQLTRYRPLSAMPLHRVHRQARPRLITSSV